jgi:ADP-heptose:LPS heptosyltransferase
VRSDPKHRQLARQVGGVSTIQASSMAVTFYSKITLRPGSIFCFGTISSVADEEGTLHHIADLPEEKSPPTNSENAGEAQPPALRKKIVCGKSGAKGPPTRKTPLSTFPTKEWTQIARKKETKGKQIVLSVPPPSKENGKKIATTCNTQNCLQGINSEFPIVCALSAS